MAFNKHLYRTLFCCVLTYSCKGQTIPALIEQLTALHTLQATISKGYQLVTGDLDSTGSITNREFSDHQDFFGRQLKTNSQLTNQILSTQKTLTMTRQSLILLISLFSTTTSTIHAQSIPDLLAELSLDTQKLTTMKSTLTEMYKGYQKLSEDYTRVRDIARDNFNLHRLFLDGLWILSPVVRSDPHFTHILVTEARFVTDYKMGTGRLGGSGNPFTVQELDYIVDTYSTLLKLTEQGIEELTMVTTDNQLRMSDAQRLQAIARIDADAQNRLRLLQQFNDMLTIQIIQRQKTGADINSLKSLYGLPH